MEINWRKVGGREGRKVKCLLEDCAPAFSRLIKVLIVWTELTR